MLNKLFAAAVAATVVFSALPFAHGATPTEITDSALILKKKKAADLKALEAERIALEMKIKKARKAIDANFTTGSIAPVQTKKKSITIKTSTSQLPQARTCTNFFQCLFNGRHRNVNVQQASLGQAPGMVMSGKTSSQTVDWNETKYPVGSLIVKTPERALYFVSGKGEAIRYAVGVGREGMQWSGNSSIVSKQEWPSWTPPQVMIEREALKGHIIPPFMEGGPGNPLGARALYIGGRMYRVHGTNNEASIGGAVSSGCIRMMNADVIDLYDRVKVGAKIYVYQ
jgi:lipoprotein-anchoring transpeptidase ErfK/SrfK